MKINDNERYEITAEAFRIDTGLTAPGKSTSGHEFTEPLEERIARWTEWLDTHRKCIDALIRAVEKTL